MLAFILWICISAQQPDRAAHDTAKYNSIFPVPSISPLPPNPPSSSFCSLIRMFILKICFSPGLKQGLHLKFSFTKQKNILLEGNGIKGKWFSVCPEARHRQDLICYVQLESGLIRRDERGCLIKFTFHFLTWHQSPVTHGTDGNAANNFCQNLVGETDWEMRRQKGGKEGESGLFLSFGFSDGNRPIESGRHDWWSPPHWKDQVHQWETWGRQLGVDMTQLCTRAVMLGGESMDWRRGLSLWRTRNCSCQLKKWSEDIQTKARGED